MDDHSFTVRVPRRWVRIALIVGVTALIVAPLTAVATHSFTDVPNTHTFHADIEWLKDTGVTRGCNPPDNTEYCPDDFVTRAQMSAFMKRLAESRAVDAGTLQGLDASAFYTTDDVDTKLDELNARLDELNARLDEVDAKLSAPTHIGTHEGVGNNAGCTTGVSVVITDANGNPHDARFSFQLGGNEAWGQIRANASIRQASSNVDSVTHVDGSGIYCIQLNGGTTTAAGEEATVVSLHSENFPSAVQNTAGAETLPGND